MMCCSSRIQASFVLLRDDSDVSLGLAVVVVESVNAECNNEQIKKRNVVMLTTEVTVNEVF